MASGEEPLDLVFILEFLRASVAGGNPIAPEVQFRVRETPRDAAALGPWHSLGQLMAFGVYFFNLAFGSSGASAISPVAAIALFRSFVVYTRRLIAWRFTPILKLSCDTSPYVRKEGAHWVRLSVEEALHLKLHDGILEHIYGERLSASNAAIQRKCLEMHALDEAQLVERLAQSDADRKVLRKFSSSVQNSRDEIPAILKSLWTTAKTPCAKLRAVVNTSKAICAAVPGAGADELLPLFLWVVIRCVGGIAANEGAPNLASHAAFIEDHCSHEESLMLSEGGYAMALLQTAIEAIRDMK